MAGTSFAFRRDLRIDARTVKHFLSKIVAKPDRSTGGDLASAHKLSGSDITGQTVFRDRALRFKHLTVAEAGEAEALSLLEEPAVDAFKIRIAKQGGSRREAKTLVEQRYARRGYQIPAQEPDPFLSTFVAYDEGQLVGTVSVRLDCEKGLSADELYRGEIDGLRSAGHRVFEFTRLAVDATAVSKPVLASLFHTAYLYAAVVRGFTHSVIEVNPRHVSYYGRALKFQVIGPERMNQRVKAPAVLLGVPMEVIAEGIAKYAGKPGNPEAKRSLFPYGFPPDEENGVLGRLRELVEST